MFLELFAEVDTPVPPLPSACLERLMEELSPPAVELLLGWLLKTKLDVGWADDAVVVSALGV